jgi:hypothetical protein
VTPCCPVKRYQRFGGTCCHDLLILFRIRVTSGSNLGLETILTMVSAIFPSSSTKCRTEPQTGPQLLHSTSFPFHYRSPNIDAMLIKPTINKQSCNGSVGIATGYMPDGQGIGVRLPVGARDFSRLHGVQIGYYPTGNRCSYSGDKAAGA